MNDVLRLLGFERLFHGDEGGGFFIGAGEREDGLLVIADGGQVAQEFGDIKYAFNNDVGDLGLFDHAFYHEQAGMEDLFAVFIE